LPELQYEQGLNSLTNVVVKENRIAMKEDRGRFFLFFCRRQSLENSSSFLKAFFLSKIVQVNEELLYKQSA
jgi:hypothetical protein